MNIIKAAIAGKKAMGKGQIVANPEKWKRLQIVVVNLVAFGMAGRELLCAVQEDCYGVSTSMVTVVGTIVAWLLFAGYHAWSTWSTSKKVGWGKAFQEEIDDLQNDFSVDDAPNASEPEQLHNTRLSSAALRSNARREAKRDHYGNFKPD